MRVRAGAHAPDDAPLVLAAPGPHGPVVHAANKVAEKLGIRCGARVVDMRALCPALTVHDADPEGDRAVLDKLVLWARRWCPWSAADGPDAIVLDVTGSTHLWDGEAAMLATIEAGFARIGFAVQLAMAPTHGAAWALSRFAPRARMICDQDAILDHLAPLSVQALRLDGETVLLLRRLGLKTIGALEALPRLALARRFAGSRAALAAPLLRLDQAFGRRAEPIVSAAEPARFCASIRLAEPVMDVGPYLSDLAGGLCMQLGASGMGARRLRFLAFRLDGDVGAIEAGTSRPSRTPRHLERLFDGRFDRLDPGFGIDAVALEALFAEPLDPGQVRLDGDEDAQIALANLIDRLVARFGSRAVTRPGLRESHLPERAEFWVPALEGRTGEGACAHAIERPLRLLAHPEEIRVLYSVPEGPPARFVWRRLAHDVARHEGPERIAPEWWRSRSSVRLRDYYRIEDDQGRRYWMFREGVIGDGRGGPPRWFMHGLFA